MTVFSGNLSPVGELTQEFPRTGSLPIFVDHITKLQGTGGTSNPELAIGTGTKQCLIDLILN
jgi:hypothetical protein